MFQPTTPPPGSAVNSTTSTWVEEFFTELIYSDIRGDAPVEYCPDAQPGAVYGDDEVLKALFEGTDHSVADCPGVIDGQEQFRTPGEFGTR